MSIVDMIQILYPSLYSIHDLPPDVGESPPPPPRALAGTSEDAAHFGVTGGGTEGIWGRPQVGFDIPVPLPPTAEKLTSEGIFLLDSGGELLLYVGRTVKDEVMRELFEVESVAGE